MAENSELTQLNTRTDKFLLYIAPQRIQKRRYQDLKNAAVKRKLRISEEYRQDVTHIVTEFENREQLLRCFNLEEKEFLESCEILSMSWFIASMKAGQPVDIEEKHRLQSEKHLEEEKSVASSPGNSPLVSEWACQRITCLQHHNSIFTTALELVQLHAELRDSDQDYSRALAFRRASCVLKSLPFTVTSLSQIDHLKDLGGHSKQIIKEISEDGTSVEVEKIKNDVWFQKMKLFTAVFGIGPSTAKKWIERGWSSVQEARQEIHTFSDWRVEWGLAFHEDLTTEVTRREADHILSMVSQEIEEICPGAIVQLTGGFRRGKPKGHDVDLLITHPDEGKEKGLLSKLLKRFEILDVILCGNLERSSFKDEAMVKDFKISPRGQLDHFEKWLGIIKIERQFNLNSGGKIENEAPQNVCSTGNISCEGKINRILGESPKKVNNNPGKRTSEESLDTDSLSPSTKRCKTNPEGSSPCKLANSERSWLARRVDLIIAPYSQYYYALVGWTGSKQYNRDLRLYATKKLDMKLTSHGLYDLTKSASVPANSEKEVFENLNLEYREPSERNC